jgi:hypothetical protein
MVIITMVISTEVPQKKLKTELSCGTAKALLGIYPKESKSTCNRDTYVHMFTTALFTIAKLWNQPRCPSMDE